MPINAESSEELQSPTNSAPFRLRTLFLPHFSPRPPKLTWVVEHRVQIPVRSPDFSDGHPVRVSVEHESLLAVVARCAQLPHALAARRDEVHAVESLQGRVEDLHDR